MCCTPSDIVTPSPSGRPLQRPFPVILRLVYRPLGKTSRSWSEYVNGGHRHEHWLVRSHQHGFATEEAKAVFWERFDDLHRRVRLTPSVTSLLSNQRPAR